MRKQLIFIFILFLTFIGMNVSNAQVSLNVSTAISCDTLKSIAYLEPPDAYDTITTISWILDGKTISTGEDSLKLILSEPGKYSLKARVNGEYQVEGMYLSVVPSPDARFAWKDTIAGNDFIYLFKSMLQEPDSLTYDYEWKIEDVLQGNLPKLNFTFTQPNIYKVSLMITNSEGCSDLQTQTIVVRELLKCPNVFTPNMDSHNDVFIVKTDGISIYEFNVFSKAGIKVYSSESPTITWDGRSMSGIEMQTGIYYYTIQNITGENPSKVSGFVHLIR